MTDRNPWHGISGLADDFDATVSSVEFCYDSEYGDGKVAIARIQLDGDGGEEETLKLSLGKGWEPGSKGRSAQREDGSDPKPFYKTSAYGRFILKACEAGAEETLIERGMPWEAAPLEGLRFHFMREEYTPVQWTDEEGKEKPTRLMPDNFLGGEEEKPKKAAPAKKAPAKAAPKKDDADDDEGDAGGDAGADLPVKVKVKLKNLAKQADSHDEFVELAYSEIDDAEEYESIIMDDSETGFFETARA